MAETIHVNGVSNSLAHKGCMGFVKNTIPDVCKTPSPGGPIPIPYPVIVSFAKDLSKGTKTIKVDRGNSAAIKGSEYSRCIGDEPGTAGGIISSTNMKEATWLLYSFDVKMEGKNACRLSDKMMMNHKNTVSLGGAEHAPVVGEAEEAVPLCECCKGETHVSNQKTTAVDMATWYTTDNNGEPLPKEDQEAFHKLMDKVHRKKTPNRSGKKKCSCNGKVIPRDPKCSTFYNGTSAEETQKIANKWSNESKKGNEGKVIAYDPVNSCFKDGKIREPAIRTKLHTIKDTPVMHLVPKAAGGCPVGLGNLQAKDNLCPYCKTLDDEFGELQKKAVLPRRVD